MKKKKLPKIRKPLPKQTGGPMKSIKDYNRKRDNIKIRKGEEE